MNIIMICKPGGIVLGGLNGVDENTVTLRQSVADLWELSFEVARYIDIDGVLQETNYYNSIEELMELFIECEFGKIRFQIDESPRIQNDGIKEIKSVTAHSIEAELKTKYLHQFKVNCGTKDSQEYLCGYYDDETGEFVNTNINPATGLPIDYIVIQNDYEQLLAEVKTKLIDFDITHKVSLEDGSIMYNEELYDFLHEIYDMFPRLGCHVVSEKGTSSVFIFLALNNGVFSVGKNPDDEFYSADYLLNGLDVLCDYYHIFWPQLSLISLAFENAKVAGWNIGDVPEYLRHARYNFSVESRDVLSFFKEEFTQAVKVIVDFDRFERLINVIDIGSGDFAYDTGVFMTYRNLINNVDISSSSEDGIRTKFIPTGSDNLGITYVNFGEDAIYDFDWMMEKIDSYGDYQYVSREMHDKYIRWKSYRYDEPCELRIDGEKYSFDNRRNAYAELSRMYNRCMVEIDEIKNKLPNDGCSINYTTFTLKELNVAWKAYNNALDALIKLYLADVYASVFEMKSELALSSLQVAEYIGDAVLIYLGEISFSDLPDDLSHATVGSIYKIKDAYVTDTRFERYPVYDEDGNDINPSVDGSDVMRPAGDLIYFTTNGLWGYARQQSIEETWYRHDFHCYRDTIIPNVENALKIYVKTDSEGNLDPNDPEQMDPKTGDWLEYPGGNQWYNADPKRVTENMSDAYVYDMDLYGTVELEAKKKAWMNSAATLFKPGYVLVNGEVVDEIPYDSEYDLNVANKKGWDLLSDTQKEAFSGISDFINGLNTYLDYMAKDLSRYNGPTFKTGFLLVPNNDTLEYDYTIPKVDQHGRIIQIEAYKRTEDRNVFVFVSFPLAYGNIKYVIADEFPEDGDYIYNDYENSWTWLMYSGKSYDPSFINPNTFKNAVNEYKELSEYIPPKYNSLTKEKTKGVVWMAQDAIDALMPKIEEIETKQNEIQHNRQEIAKSVVWENPEFNFTGKELEILYTLVAESDYNNPNILITNLDNIVSTVDYQERLYQDAVVALSEKSRPQLSFQISSDNLFALEEFSDFGKQIRLLNFVRISIGLYDDEFVKLRVVGIESNPFIPSSELSLEFSNMTYSLQSASDIAYMFGNTSSSSSSGGSSSGGGGGVVYGTNDAEIQIANNMLNALLKSTNYTNSIGKTVVAEIAGNAEIRNLISQSGIFESLETGNMKISGDCITDHIKSSNYNPLTKEGAYINLQDGTFTFANGQMTYSSDDGFNVDGGGITTGTIKSKNYPSAGSMIDLENGSFSFGSNKITWDSESDICSIDSSVQVSGDSLIGGVIKDPGGVSQINLSNGQFSFANGNLKYEDNTLSMTGNVEGTNWSITPNDGFVYNDVNKLKLGGVPVVGQDISADIVINESLFDIGSSHLSVFQMPGLTIGSISLAPKYRISANDVILESLPTPIVQNEMYLSSYLIYQQIIAGESETDHYDIYPLHLQTQSYIGHDEPPNRGYIVSPKTIPMYEDSYLVFTIVYPGKFGNNIHI